MSDIKTTITMFEAQARDRMDAIAKSQIQTSTQSSPQTTITNTSEDIYKRASNMKIPVDSFMLAERVALADGSISSAELKILQEIRDQEKAKVKPSALTLSEAIRLGFDVAASDGEVKLGELQKRDEVISQYLKMSTDKAKQQKAMERLQLRFD